MASICPRGPNKTQECIDSVNAGIQGLCEDLGCTYTDTTYILKQGDGSINEGYYLDDLVHLTYKGQNKVAKKLGIIPSNKGDAYSVVSTKRDKRDQHQKNAPTRVQERSAGKRKAPANILHVTRDSQPAHSTNNTATPMTTSRQTRHEHQSRSSNAVKRPLDTQNVMREPHRCPKCAEPNHNVDRCHHWRPVKCHECGIEGHKSKYCESININQTNY